MLENFIYSKKKTLFEEALNKGEVLDEAIVFIEDTKEIWNHGTYFDGNTFSLFNQGDGFKFLSDDGTYKEVSTKIDLSDYALKSEVVTESLLESKGFLTQSDKTELSNYDNSLLEKLNTLESKLTEALGRISTLETELANTLNIG